ncbi:hypothetical protein BKA70DRAFT_118257 [Coprinopsis sp. MPI-PUGE-AT-0042]|nr:hypothetical protein BKA70DRAFT_118257 [Coprinopsis sp. MPI-PUGE-AT-0042]
MYSPHQLLPYFSSNIPIPHHLEPVLETYLSQTAGFIADLDAEIDQLQSMLDAKRRRRDQYKKGYEEHFQLQSSVRNIPPEIWGVIFGFTLGDEPFGQREYRTYGYLREVCTIWRDVVASTPGLCRGLEVHLDERFVQALHGDGNGLQHVKDKLKPWLAIINSPYHLVLGIDDDLMGGWLWTEGDVTGIVKWLLTTAPTPSLLSVTNTRVFSLVYANAPRDNQISSLRLDGWKVLGPKTLEAAPFQETFPCLKNLFIDTPIRLTSTIGHSNLQFLTLTQIKIHWHDSAQGFSTLLLGFPALQELHIGSEDRCYPPENRSNQSTPLKHPTLEILIVEGEDLMLLLEHITFPSLQFLGLKSWGLNGDYEYLAGVLPAFLQRCSLHSKDFTMSFKGRLFKFVFDLLIHGLPRRARLHLDADIQVDKGEVPLTPASTQAHNFTEVFCTCRPHDFTWLRGDHVNSPGEKMAKLYMPNGVLKGDEVQQVQDKVGDWGYTPEILDMDDYKRLLRSSIPKMTLDWQA